MSLGARGRISLSPQDTGKGVVHCFDDRSVEAVLRELDTITDFVAYLEAKEGALRQGQRVVGLYGEEHLLAIYQHNGKKFPDANLLLVEGDLWSSFQQNPAYQRRLEADQVSYAWDRLIEYLSDHVLAGRMEFGNGLSENEAVLRVMARENRLARRIIAKNFLEFLDRAQQHDVRATTIPSPSRVTYVFFNAPPSYGRESRVTELRCRCFVARDKIRENETVVGIGVNTEPAPQGYAEDLVLFSCSEWTHDDEVQAEEMRRELGLFRQPRVRHEHFDEYPEA